MKSYSMVRYKKQIETRFYDYGYRLAQWIHNRFFKKTGKILDIGCSRGRFALGFQKLGYKGYGLDYDAAAITDAIEKGLKAKVVDMEKNKIPYKDNYFDYVFMRNFVEHIFNYEHLFLEVKRVLKPKGKLFIITDDYSTRLKGFFNDPTHKKPYTLETLNRIANFYDFKIIYLKRFQHIPYLWRFTLKIFDMRIPWGIQDLIFVGENVK